MRERERASTRTDSPSRIKPPTERSRPGSRGGGGQTRRVYSSSGYIPRPPPIHKRQQGGGGGGNGRSRLRNNTFTAPLFLHKRKNQPSELSTPPTIVGEAEVLRIDDMGGDHRGGGSNVEAAGKNNGSSGSPPGGGARINVFRAAVNSLEANSVDNDGSRSSFKAASANTAPPPTSPSPKATVAAPSLPDKSAATQGLPMYILMLKRYHKEMMDLYNSFQSGGIKELDFAGEVLRVLNETAEQTEKQATRVRSVLQQHDDSKQGHRTPEAKTASSIPSTTPP
mmetsp:Transcript_1551/g.2223  ORF Transcript_1551/g.2223 Transcript_1551/m.2223 type:complete len:282 (+) Transcript_1551:192-1037(+)